MPADDPNMARVDELYQAWTALEDGRRPAPPALSFGDLVHFFARGGELSASQQQLLFRSEKLRSAFRRLKEDFAAVLPQSDTPAANQTSSAFFIMPALAAAASGGEVEERSFPGALIRIVPARSGDRVYVNIHLESADPRPVRLQVERLNVAAERLESLVVTLGEPDENNLIQLVRKPDDPLVKLLKAPDATGMFFDQ